MSVTYAECANLATRHRARGANLVGAGKRMPEAERSVTSRDGAGRALTAGAAGRSLPAAGAGRSIPAEGG